jgi:tRNA A-37 threonylcarbamoyl transferase component Bud32
MNPVPSAPATPEAEPRLEAGTVVAGRYRVERLLGAGGMGAVYRAEHVHMRKTVALKVLHRELANVDEVVTRFEREAIAAARIEHPNVVAASDFGKLDDGSFYLVLEYIDGKSLRELIAQGPVPTERVIEIARQTTLALSAAHAAEIVHRDLKPDNVMLLSEPDGTSRVKVLDFGIARVSLPNAPDATHLTRVGVVMGTIAYMSPEQATGQSVDGRSDLYSLGVMMYEMIAGRQPFEAELPSQVLARQLVEPPPPLPSSTPPALVALVMDLLAKAPADRPATARDVLDRLARLRNASPVRGAAAALPPRVMWYAGAGVAVLFLLVLVVALGGGEEAAGAAAAESAAPSASASAPATLAKSVVKPAPAVSAALPTAQPSASAPRTAQKSGAKKARSGEQKKGERQTGPGGIYIPPPSTWFKGLE